jgi:tripartite-type tricarboxylate transporter receptor subunit TctC
MNRRYFFSQLARIALALHARRLAALLLAGISLSAAAQSYPNRPVRLIVPFSAGGPSDAAARLVAAKLSETWGQQVVIDNRAGGNTFIGTEIAARAAPDGYTLLNISSSFTINASLFPKLPYDSRKDFTAVAPISFGPGVLTVHPSVNARTVKELIALAKSKPNTLSFGSSGTGSPGHITIEMLSRMTGMELIHVPYKGMAPAIIDLLAGQVQISIPTISAVLPYLKSGRLRALAVTSAKRWPATPDLPTIAEAAIPGFESVLWYGIVGPARMPAAIVTQINREVGKIVQLPDVRERLDAMGMGAMTMTAAEFASYIQNEIDKLAKVVKASGAKPE